MRFKPNGSYSVQVFKMCQCLPLLPPHRIEEGYDAITQFAQTNDVLLQLVTFLAYVYRVWIAGMKLIVVCKASAK